MQLSSQVAILAQGDSTPAVQGIQNRGSRPESCRTTAQRCPKAGQGIRLESPPRSFKANEEPDREAGAAAGADRTAQSLSPGSLSQGFSKSRAGLPTRRADSLKRTAQLRGDLLLPR